MSFWQTSDGEQITAENTGTTFDSGGGNFEPIPRGTILQVVGVEAKWKDWEGSEYIGIRWDVVDGEYKNRVVFQNVYVEHDDASKRKKALRMLATVDKLTGKRILSSKDRPTDYDLASICNHPIELRVGVYKERNFVEAVGAIGALSGSSKPQPQAQPRQQQRAAPAAASEFDDGIPF